MTIYVCFSAHWEDCSIKAMNKSHLNWFQQNAWTDSRQITETPELIEKKAWSLHSQENIQLNFLEFI